MLTAIVISFGMTALSSCLSLRGFLETGSDDGVSLDDPDRRRSGGAGRDGAAVDEQPWIIVPVVAARHDGGAAGPGAALTA